MPVGVTAHVTSAKTIHLLQVNARVISMPSRPLLTAPVPPTVCQPHWPLLFLQHPCCFPEPLHMLFPLPRTHFPRLPMTHFQSLFSLYSVASLSVRLPGCVHAFPTLFSYSLTGFIFLQTTVIYVTY